jgi:hypothetical protein
LLIWHCTVRKLALIFFNCCSCITITKAIHIHSHCIPCWKCTYWTQLFFGTLQTELHVTYDSSITMYDAHSCGELSENVSLVPCNSETVYYRAHVYCNFSNQNDLKYKYFRYGHPVAELCCMYAYSWHGRPLFFFLYPEGWRIRSLTWKTLWIWSSCYNSSVIIQRRLKLSFCCASKFIWKHWCPQQTECVCGLE